MPARERDATTAAPAAMRRLLSLALTVIAAAVFGGTAIQSGGDAGWSPGRDGQSALELRAVDDAGEDTELQQACGTCHRVPPADILPRAAWRDAIGRMQAIQDGVDAVMSASAATPLSDAFAKALAYYERRAPEALAPPEAWPAEAASPSFERRWLTPPDAPPTPAISNVQLLDVEGDERPELIACDMRHGMVLLGRPYDRGAPLVPIADLASPSHAVVVDLDRDGTRDLLVAELGEFLPRDHKKGAVVWLRGVGGGRYAPFSIGGLPRVADARAADVDGDGDLDLLVAAFGFRRTGGVLLLENRTTDWSQPQFAPKALDERPGAVALETADLNGDRRVDFVTVLAQEHEQVIAFLHSGGLSFRPEVLYTAPHPHWGSSGLALADLDADDDLDILLSNGDTFDDSLLRPYLGLGWMENVTTEGGGLRFDYRRLAAVQGPHGVRAVDLDGDRDLDVLASALVVGGAGEADARLPGLVWLEQVAPRRFERRTLMMGHPRHASFAAADFDGDGDVDLVVGEMATGPAEGWVRVLENRDRTPGP